MVLRSQTIRLGIFASALVLAAIIIFQLIWLRKVYYFEQKEFDHSIVRAVRNFYEDVGEEGASTIPTHLSDLITRQNSQTYLVRFDQLKQYSVSDYDSLAFYLHTELEDEDIFTDCYMSIYDSAKKQYVFNTYLKAAPYYKTRKYTAPQLEEPYSYLMLYFPHRRQYIVSLMNFWIISSAVLLIVILLFGGSLFYFYRQQFLNETQKDFINNFTHEFKTPVSIINLTAETLESPDILKKPERLAKYTAILKYQGRYLQNQIERLLHYAYAESRQLRLKKEEVHLHEVIEEALRNLDPLIGERGARIELHLEANNDLLLSDKGYLLIVVINLIENAIKYAKQPNVLISTANEDTGVVLSVKDNGRGIESQYLKKIFEKFYRVTNGEQVSARGFGLGLPFVKRIVEAHHGRISVESIPQVGSNFAVWLPALAAGKQT